MNILTTQPLAHVLDTLLAQSETITAEEAARTGLKETPSEDMDRKFMFACIGIVIFEVILMGIVA